VHGAVTRYRVMSYAAGSMLILLFFVAVPLKYLAGQPQVSNVLGVVHGMLTFPLYLAAGFDLYRRTGWPLGRMVLMVAAGVVPFLTFTVERKIARELRGSAATESPSA
jgi:integral membrane protein